MLDTIRQQNPASILIPFEVESIKQELNILLEKAGKYGVLKELVNYWNKHPNLHEFHQQDTAAFNGAGYSLGDEIDAVPVGVVEEEENRGAVVVSQHLEVQKSTVKPILPHEILLKIADYIAAGDDFINWVKALEEEQYPSRGDLPLILQQDCGLLCVCSMHQQQERMHSCIQKCRISSHTLIFHFLFRLFILFEWLFLV